MSRLLVLALVACHAATPRPPDRDAVVIVSANAEWRALEQVVHPTARGTTPWGETLEDNGVLYIHGGWGKVAAAASAQYAIDRWHPRVLVNLGTCGGFAGATKQFDVVVADRTVIYDIVERMGDPREAIEEYVGTSSAWICGRRVMTRFSSGSSPPMMWLPHCGPCVAPCWSPGPPTTAI